MSRERTCNGIVQILFWRLKTIGVLSIPGKVRYPFRVLCHPDAWEQHHAHSILDLHSPGQCQGQCPCSTFPSFMGLSQPTLLFSPTTAAIVCHIGHMDRQISVQVLPWSHSYLSPSWDKTHLQTAQQVRWEQEWRKDHLCHSFSVHRAVELTFCWLPLTIGTPASTEVSDFSGATSICVAAGWEGLLQSLNPALLQWWEVRCWDLLLLNSGEEWRESINGMFPRMQKLPFSET